jgi:hypothetical protein
MNKVKIKFDKISVEFHFGLGFLGELLDSVEMGIDEVMEAIGKNPFKIIPIIMHSSASYNAKRKGEEFKYTIYSFIDLIDENGGIAGKPVQLFLEAFTNSMTQDVPKESEAPKKKGLVKK